MGRRVRLTLGFTQDAPAWIGRQERDVRSALRRDLRNQGVQDLRALALSRVACLGPVRPGGHSQTTTEQWQGPPARVRDGQRAGGGRGHGNELHAATTDGGVWASTDGGTSWAPPATPAPASASARWRGWTPGHHLPLQRRRRPRRGGPALPGWRPGAVLRRGPLWHPLDGGVGASGFAARDINAILAVAPDRLLAATDQGLFYSARRRAELRG
ncbi:MAG: hypothetical protein R3F43_18990 [bacterium]